MWSDVFPHDAWQKYTKTTSDATKTTWKSISVPTNKTVFVQIEITGQKSDVSAYGAWKLSATFYRASGNVAQDGTTHENYVELSSGLTATCDIEADTATQTVICTITGVASETWRWKCKVRHAFAN